MIGLTKLRKNYKTFETKRKLVSSYDLFLTDDRIVTFMPALLGKAFYEKKRNPIPISLTKSNLAAQVRTQYSIASGAGCLPYADQEHSVVVFDVCQHRRML